MPFADFYFNNQYRNFYLDSLFVEPYEYYRLRLLYFDLYEYISKFVNCDPLQTLSSFNLAYVRGVLDGFTNNEIADALNIRTSVLLRNKIAMSLTPFIRDFLEIQERMDWVRFGSILEKRGYKKSCLQLDLNRLSQPSSILADIVSADEFIAAIEERGTSRNKIQRISEDSTELQQEANKLWKEGQYADSVTKHLDVINGNLTDPTSIDSYMSVLYGLHELNAFNDCYKMIKCIRSRIKDNAALSNLYLISASYLEELSLSLSCPDYWLDARSDYHFSLKQNPTNIYSAWSLVKFSIEFDQKCNIDPDNCFDYVKVAENDFDYYFKPILELDKTEVIPDEIRDSINATISTLDEGYLRSNIINTIQTFDTLKG